MPIFGRAWPPVALQSRRESVRSFDSSEPFFPNVIELHRRDHVPQAIFGNLAKFSFFHQTFHVHAGDAVAFGRLDAKRFAVEIEIELSRRAVAPAYAVK